MKERNTLPRSGGTLQNDNRNHSSSCLRPPFPVGGRLAAAFVLPVMTTVIFTGE